MNLTLAVIALLMGAGLVATSQNTRGQTASPQPTANAWILTPTPYLAWNENVLSSVRAERDRFWDSVSYGRGVGGPDFFAGESEIQNSPNRAILTASFIKHGSVLSASEYSMYTEATLQVDELFQDRTGSGRPCRQKEITLLLPGGTVTLRNGQTLYEDIPLRNTPLTPAHKYLFVLSYHAEGDFYTYTDYWDISDGTVHPNTERARHYAALGRSSLSGLKAQQLAPALDKLLHEQP